MRKNNTIEVLLKDLKSQLKAGEDCYMDLEGANADDLNELVHVIKFLENYLETKR